MGNICWLGCIFQLFVRPLLEYKGLGDEILMSTSDQSICKQICELDQALKSGDGNAAKSAMNLFCQLFTTFCPKCKDHRKLQDAQEGWLELVEACDRMQSLVSCKQVCKHFCALCEHTCVKPVNPTYCLVLPIAGRSLQSCVDSLFEPSPLPNYHCQKCGKSGRAGTQQLDFKEYPPFLPVSLNRYISHTQNSQHTVQVPEVLSLASSRYRLVGGVEHRGNTLKEGHYTTWVCWDAWWCHFDDLKVGAPQSRHQLNLNQISMSMRLSAPGTTHGPARRGQGQSHTSVRNIPDGRERIGNQEFDPRTTLQFLHSVLIIDLGYCFIDLCGHGLHVVQGLRGCSSSHFWPLWAILEAFRAILALFGPFETPTPESFFRLNVLFVRTEKRVSCRVEQHAHCLQHQDPYSTPTPTAPGPRGFFGAGQGVLLGYQGYHTWW